MNEVKLKPFPFCGGEAKIISGYGKYAVTCKGCDAMTTSTYTESDAAKAWNKRNGHQTYREYFEEQFPWDAFPDADARTLIDGVRVCDVFGGKHIAPDCTEICCDDHWDREMS